MIGTARRSLTSAALALAFATPLVAPVSAENAGSPTPAPLRGWEKREPAPGVTLYEGTVGPESPRAHWTVSVLFDGSAPLGSREDAAALARRLRSAGFSPEVQEVRWPRGADVAPGTVGRRIRVGAFDSEGQARRAEKRIDAAGFDSTTEWTGTDSVPGTGSAQIKVAVVDPREFDGRLTASPGAAVSGRQDLTSIASRKGAVLGVNAGFFVIGREDGVPGAPAGIAVYDGEVQSEATEGRVAMILGGKSPGERPRMARLSTEVSVRAGGRHHRIDGVNRVPGLIRNCGGVGGDTPTQQPLHDVTCNDPSELVLFTDEFGAPTPTVDGVEVVVAPSGRVTDVREPGGPVPRGGHVIQGTGSGARWLRENARVGSPLRIDTRVTDETGRPVALGPRTDIVNGGPMLVEDGEISISLSHGIIHPDDRSFAYQWGIKRHARTVIGTDRRGRILIATVNGGMPGRSEGWGLREAARFMKSLGAVQAMNLDGGGSTGMVVNGDMITNPSDDTGERAIGDTLLLVPGA